MGNYTKRQVKEWVNRNKGAQFLNTESGIVVEVMGLDEDGDVNIFNTRYEFTIGEYLSVILDSAYYKPVYTDKQFIKDIEDL